MLDKEKQALVILSSKIPRDETVVVKIGDKYFRVKELG